MATTGTDDAPRRNPALRQRHRTVVFDCDATLSAIEGIEELGAARRAEVAALTDAAMRGDIPLEQVYGRRLALANPNRAAVAAVGQLYVETLVPDARQVVAALHAAGIEVRIVSSGVLPAVLVLAESLGIPSGRVAAVDIRFDAGGEYLGFDETSPLARSGGKPEVLQRWGAALRRPVMMVGDGATDLETKPVADLFVAYAGVVARPAVVAGADVVIRSVSVAPVLPLALGFEPPADAAVRTLYDKGIRLLDAVRGD